MTPSSGRIEEIYDRNQALMTDEERQEREER
jgi:hypothetical protein